MTPRLRWWRNAAGATCVLAAAACVCPPNTVSSASAHEFTLAPVTHPAAGLATLELHAPPDAKPGEWIELGIATEARDVVAALYVNTPGHDPVLAWHSAWEPPSIRVVPESSASTTARPNRFEARVRMPDEGPSVRCVSLELLAMDAAAAHTQSPSMPEPDAWRHVFEAAPDQARVRRIVGVRLAPSAEPQPAAAPEAAEAECPDPPAATMQPT